MGNIDGKMWLGQRDHLQDQIDYLMWSVRTWRVSGRIWCHVFERNITMCSHQLSWLSLRYTAQFKDNHEQLRVPAPQVDRNMQGRVYEGTSTLLACSQIGKCGSKKTPMQTIWFLWLREFIGSSSLEVHLNSVLHFKHLTPQLLYWADMKTKQEG